MERQSVPQPLTTANGPTDWNEAMDIISFGSPEQVKNSFFPLWIFSLTGYILLLCASR